MIKCKQNLPQKLLRFWNVLLKVAILTKFWSHSCGRPLSSCSSLTHTDISKHATTSCLLFNTSPRSCLKTNQENKMAPHISAILVPKYKDSFTLVLKAWTALFSKKNVTILKQSVRKSGLCHKGTANILTQCSSGADKHTESSKSIALHCVTA